MIRFKRSSFGNKNLGTLGEDAAADFLKKKGYKIIERNFRCKYGEIDLIVTKDEFIVFIEVKSRKANEQKTSPLISVTSAKKEKLRLLGSFFLQAKTIQSRQPRFDVIGITFQKNNQIDLEHIENAF